MLAHIFEFEPMPIELLIAILYIPGYSCAFFSKQMREYLCADQSNIRTRFEENCNDVLVFYFLLREFSKEKLGFKPGVWWRYKKC